MIHCPFCGEPLELKLIANFYFCKKCEIAVRDENDMPLRGVNIYNTEWAIAQEGKKYHLARAALALKQVQKLPRVRTVLDIGCGTGVLVDLLVRKGYLADGIDSSPAAIEFAKLHRKGRFYLASSDFRSKHRYDLIVATQLIEHLRNPEAFLLNVKRLLKPLGYLYIETPNLYSWNKKSIWRRRIGGMVGMVDHRICYTSTSLCWLLNNNGFDICKVFTKTYSPTIFAETVVTLYSGLFKNGKAAKREKEPVADLADAKAKRSARAILNSIYEWLKGSLIIDGLLLIPNKISQIGSRGHQLIAIAQKAA